MGAWNIDDGITTICRFAQTKTTTPFPIRSDRWTIYVLGVCFVYYYSTSAVVYFNVMDWQHRYSLRSYGDAIRMQQYK
jgi:hypothetical protein